jgi:prevent-host-death family protein
MKSVGSYEAKTHLPRLLSRVEKGETITITKRGKPVAVLSPAQPLPQRDVKVVIAEFRAYSKEQVREHRSLSAREIKEMIEEGRP